MSNKSGKVFSIALWSVFSGVFALLFIALTVVSAGADAWFGAALNMAFGTSNFKTVTNDSDGEAKDFYTTSYEFERNSENLYKEDAAMIEEAEAAGAVLMWNKSKALPLAGSEKVSLFGHAVADITVCGTGSGYVRSYDYNARKDVTVTTKSAFESRGFTVNDALWNFYTTGAGSKYKMISWDKTACTEWRQWNANEVPQNEYTVAVKNSYNEFNDLAVVMFARSGGEYSDLHYNYKSTTDYTGDGKAASGGYLGLSKEEKDLLAAVTQANFKKVIVLLNTGNPLQMQDFEPYMDKIDACMWIGQPGTTGINAVVDLLKGKDMEGNELIPSGRLPDTWAYDGNSAPAASNDGNYRYGNADNYKQNSALGTEGFWSKYMVYQEGIYVGYRYYETRYADCVAGEGNASSDVGAKHSAGAWNYNSEVAFPFGYGVSYTKFDYSGFSAVRDGDEFTVKVTVTNVGDYAGRETVQVYLQKPYTSEDKSLKIEKSAIELCGYAKTGVLGKGEHEDVTIKVPLSVFKTYAAEYYETYIIEESDDYYLTVGTDAHVALNNILSKQGKTPVNQAVLGGEANTKAVSLGATFAQRFSLDADYKTFAKSEQTGNKITNKLDSGDINRYVNRGDNSVVYLSRNDWAGTYPTTHAVLSLNDSMVSDLYFDRTPDDSGYKMPDYGVFKSGSKDGKPNVKEGDLVAYMFMDAPLYPELTENKNEIYNGLSYADWEIMWDQLLNQMTFDEQAKLVANSYHLINGATSISLPPSKQENGPVGITKREEEIFSLPNDKTIKGDDGTGWTWVAYPCAGILAASFDDDIARRVGEHKSEDMLYLGYNGIYGPGVNLHRSPFGGRSFEYPSEDPYLAGYAEAAESIGIESKGCLAYAKHFALNDLETNRVNCGVWSNEQASRELYLRAFEIVFTEGKASATMNSFTRIGTTWNGASPALMTDILRGEWGYDGLVISDWVTGGSAMSASDGVMAGTDTFDGNWNETKFAPYKDNAAICQALRQASKRVIYNVVRTNAMNGVTVNTRVQAVMPSWHVAMWVITAVFGALMAGSLVLLVLSLYKKSSLKGNVRSEAVGSVDAENI